jgi:hypothetical protein
MLKLFTILCNTPVAERSRSLTLVLKPKDTSAPLSDRQGLKKFFLPCNVNCEEIAINTK